MLVAIIVLVFLVILGIGLYIAYKHLSSDNKGQCIYTTPTSGGYTCNCSKGMSQSNCSKNNGIYDSAGTCESTFIDTCKAQLIGSCIIGASCSYPSVKSDCKGTFTIGKTCS